MEHLKSIKGSTLLKVRKKHAVFGQPLESLEQPVPSIVIEMVEYLMREALTLEGIFRVPGSSLEIKKMKAMFDDGIEVDFCDNDVCKSPHSVAGLLKLFFRELPVPLLTDEFYDCFIAANSITVPEARLECSVANCSSENKMNAPNLAMVFAPNLLRTSDDNDFIQDSGHATKILETLIVDFEYIFSDTTLEIPPDETISKTNSSHEKKNNMMKSMSSSIKKINFGLKETIRKGKDNLSTTKSHSVNVITAEESGEPLTLERREFVLFGPRPNPFSSS